MLREAGNLSSYYMDKRTKLLNRELHAFSQSSSLISLSLHLILDILGDSALWLAEDANFEYPWLTWR